MFSCQWNILSKHGARMDEFYLVERLESIIVHYIYNNNLSEIKFHMSFQDYTKIIPKTISVNY